MKLLGDITRVHHLFILINHKFTTGLELFVNLCNYFLHPKDVAA
jgi:hypothetical protein